MSKHGITHPQAIEAIRVVSTLAATIQPVYPPFSYGRTPPAYRMTTGNAAPAMIVWLFLVTSPDFLDVLDGADGADSSLIPYAEIASATNLTEDAVKAILGTYVKTNPNYDAFRDVCTSFQAFSKLSGYDDLHCPKNPGAILNLALYGASVDPSAP